MFTKALNLPTAGLQLTRKIFLYSRKFEIIEKISFFLSPTRYPNLFKKIHSKIFNFF